MLKAEEKDSVFVTTTKWTVKGCIMLHIVALGCTVAVWLMFHKFDLSLFGLDGKRKNMVVFFAAMCCCAAAFLHSNVWGGLTSDQDTWHSQFHGSICTPC